MQIWIWRIQNRESNSEYSENSVKYKIQIKYTLLYLQSKLDNFFKAKYIPLSKACQERLWFIKL